MVGCASVEVVSEGDMVANLLRGDVSEYLRGETSADLRPWLLLLEGVKTAEGTIIDRLC